MTRVLRASGTSVALEDGDPYRDCYGPPAASRLSKDQFDQWQQALVAACAKIESSYPDYAPAIMAGLTVLVPVTSGLGPDGANAAERHAFGALAVFAPADPARLARLIVAAFQRAKLAAILDLYDLYDPAAGDARSVGDLLESTYVELAVGGKKPTDGAIEALVNRGALTPLGHRFLAEMRRSAQSSETHVT